MKQGGKQKTVTKTIKCDSFFNFFETVEAAEMGKPKDGDSDEDEEN